MPRYFFHITQNGAKAPDLEGTVLDDRATAWTEAITTCGEIIRDLDENLTENPDWRMDVEDEAGPLFSINVGARHIR